MSEIEKYNRARVSRGLGKQLTTIREKALIERALQETEEANIAHRVDVRLNNGSILTHTAINHAKRLSDLIENQTHDKPSQEMALREFDAVFAAGAANLIYRYMSGPE